MTSGFALVGLFVSCFQGQSEVGLEMTNDSEVQELDPTTHSREKIVCPFEITVQQNAFLAAKKIK